MQEDGPGKEIWVVLLVAVLMAVLNVSYLWIQIKNPTDTSTPESQTVYMANRVAHGENLYLDYHGPPYNIAPYTPGYYFALGYAVRFLDVELESIFVLGRGMTFFCCLVIGLLIYLSSRFDGEHSVYAFTGSCLFLSSYILGPWGSTTRPDMLAITFTIAGLLICTRSSDKKLIFSAPLFVLAFLTKQTCVSAPAAVFLHLLLQRERKNALLFAAAVAGPVAGILAIMHTSTSGLSTMNIIYGNMAPMQFQNFRVVAGPFFQVAALPMILAAAAALSNSFRDIKSLYFLLALAQGLITCSRLGSSLNYFLEALAASCLLVPSGLRTMEGALKNLLRPVLPVLALVLLLPSILFLCYSVQEVRFQEMQSIRKLVLEAKGLVISDNSRLALLSRDSFFIDPFQLSYLEKAGKWNVQGLADLLRRHEIEYVVLSRPIEQPMTWQGLARLPDGVINAVRSDYVFLRLVDNYYVYVAKR